MSKGNLDFPDNIFLLLYYRSRSHWQMERHVCQYRPGDRWGRRNLLVLTRDLIVLSWFWLVLFLGLQALDQGLTCYLSRHQSCCSWLGSFELNLGLVGLDLGLEKQTLGLRLDLGLSGLDIGLLLLTLDLLLFILTWDVKDKLKDVDLTWNLLDSNCFDWILTLWQGPDNNLWLCPSHC